MEYIFLILAVVIPIGTTVAILKRMRLLAVLGYALTLAALAGVILPQIGAIRPSTYARAKLLENVAQPYYALVDHLSELSQQGQIERLTAAVSMMDQSRGALLDAWQSNSFQRATEEIIHKTTANKSIEHD